MLISSLILILTVVPGALSKAYDYETPEYLRRTQREALFKATQLKRNYNIAKNVILGVGDGMGISTITAGRIYVGQRQNKNGEECKLYFEDFPAVALSKTYNLDRQVADSAGTAVAMMSGVKVNMGTIGVDGRVPNGNDCAKVSEETKVKSILDFALEAGKSVGIVTTTRITHATPAAAYAHSPNRDFECDSDMSGGNSINCQNEKDIARQLIEDNPNIHVILGGGKRCFLPNTSGGSRQDGRDLIEQWKRDKLESNLAHAYVDSRDAFNQVDAANTDYLLGMFSSSHMEYELKRDDSQPTLKEMARKAVEILKKNPKGYFLLVEGGRIDHAHHENYAHLSMGETEMFSDTIKELDSITGDDTLITVTADHSHVFTMSGYPGRGNPLFGPVSPVTPGYGASDNLPYLTLSYANGPSGRINGSRINYTNIDTEAIDFQQPADVKMPYETHGGEDVAIFSKGPMSHLFHSVHDQSYIAHVMMYSSCIGDYIDRADCHWEDRLQRRDIDEDYSEGSGGQALSFSALSVSSLLTIATVIALH